MRIVYFIEGMFNPGGMERVISMKANWLALNTDFSISVVSYAQAKECDDFFLLDKKINRVKLEPRCENSKNFKSTLYNSLSAWIEANPQDICISTYGREFNVLHKIKDGSKKIVEFHFIHDINLLWCANHGSCKWFSQINGFLRTKRMEFIAKCYDKIIVLTESDKRKWNNSKTICINNPTTIAPPI